ncbi:MAG: hypothetical protein B7Y41_00805 [Hydrogenophilales bacterium 28-61-23]|nr:MAG: hypothetical protein B7Y41_00805 [Hydrogenophilales bacterium 28-61-23]
MARHRPDAAIDTATVVALIAGLALLAYWNAFAGAFQFDDYNVIVDNPAVASVAAWWRSMPGIRPLLKLSYALNREWAGGDPVSGLFGGLFNGLFIFHAVNLAIHIGTALLVYAIAHRLLVDHVHAQAVALLAALLFLAHPAHTEAVTMISGRSMSLMALFYLGSLLAYLERRRWLSLAAFAVALGVRETAITLPLALLLVDRLRSPHTPLRSAIANGVWHWLLALSMAAALWLLPSFQYLASVSLATRPLADNLIAQSGAVLYLLKQALWPVALNADPTLPVFGGMSSGWNGYWVAKVALTLTLLGGALIAWRAAGLARWTGFGLLWFFLHLAPTNSLLPRLDLANERHLYLADVGLCLIAALWLASALKTRPRLLVGLAVLLVFGLMLATHQRNRVYRDEVAFWRDVAEKSPANSRAFNNLGYALAAAGQTGAALTAYERAIQLSPRDFKARLNRRALCRKIRAEKPGRTGC